jgi:long-chain acyl-CoA synthetase
MMHDRTLVPLVQAPTRRTSPATCGRPPDWPYSPLAVAARSGVQWPLFGLLGLLVRTEVQGLDHLEALDRPALFVANHTSHLDTPVLLRALPERQRRRIAVAAAHDYFFSHAALGALVGLGVGAFPIARTGDARPLIEHCGRLHERGWSLLFFPEGTRSTTGEIGPLKQGIGVLALKLGLPVVPMRTHGLFEVLPKGRRLPRPGRATVHVGAPLDFAPETPVGAVTATIGAALRAL